MKNNLDQLKNGLYSAMGETADKSADVFSGCDTDSENEIEINEGEEFQHVKDYGVGVDCHSKFIVITVLNHENDKIKIHQKEFNTNWNSLIEGRKWIQAVIEQKSTIPVDCLQSEFPHYVIESTGSFHYPVIRAFGGEPSVINASLAGASSRKTDKLDSRRLALHDLTGVWPKSYIKPVFVKTLNVILGERKAYTRMATNYNNRIYSMILKFGYSFGRDGSVTGNEKVRDTIMQLIYGETSILNDSCPDVLPDSVKEVLKKLYEKHDECQEQALIYKKKALQYAYDHEWPTAGNKKMPGAELIPLLMTAPGVGEITALTWIAYIADPNRFDSAKQVCAYCGLDPSLKISAGKVTSTKKRHGNKELHEALTRAANVVMKANNEPFGRWGNRLAKESGRWKKAVNAVARKICISLFYMQKNQESFSYDKYNLSKPPAVIDIAFEELAKVEPSFNRFVKILTSNGYSKTQELVNAYYQNKLVNVAGLGQRFFSLLKDFIMQQKKYKSVLDERTDSKDPV